MREPLNTVLVVDDDAEVRASLLDLLRDAGYAVLGASSGHEALDLLASTGPVALVITDGIMPGLSGEELASLVSADVQLRGTPVVMTSADRRLRATLPGVAAFLPKPFEPDALLALVRSWARPSSGCASA